MNIYEHAMRFEREGARFYRVLARKAPDRGMKGIFEWLAGQEDNHLEIIRSMKAGKDVSTRKRVNFRPIRKMFRSLKSHAEDLEPNPSQAGAYRKALAMENRSVSFYSGKARLAGKGETRKAFNLLASEERKHVVVMENMLEFLTGPSRWVESAEFSHIGEEY